MIILFNLNLSILQNGLFLNFKFLNHCGDFKNFKDKIIYIPVEDMPDGDDPYLRENFQRNCILRGLKSSSEDDIIIISD